MTDALGDREVRAALLMRVRTLLERCPQKKRIAHGVSKGMTNREIAQQLNRSEHTVHSLLRQIYEKTGISGRVVLGVVVDEIYRMPD